MLEGERLAEGVCVSAALRAEVPPLPQDEVKSAVKRLMIPRAIKVFRFVLALSFFAMLATSVLAG
jgi:hypothetical protein